MRQTFRKSGHNTVILFVRLPSVMIDELLHFFIFLTGDIVDRDKLPGKGIDCIEIRIHHNIKTPDLVCTGSCLHNIDSIYQSRFCKKGVRMTADDHVHTPGRIQQSRQFFVFLKSDMRQKHCKININRIVRITDISDLLGRLPDVHEGTYQLFRLCLCQHVLCNNSYEKDFHTVHFRNVKGLEQPPPVCPDMEIRVNNREICAFFQKQKMGQSIIHLMISDCRHIRAQQVHNADG